MADSDTRAKFVLSVDEQVNRSLEQAKVKAVKSGKRGNRSRGHADQRAECGFRIDISSPDSVLSQVTNPRLLFNTVTFASLPLYFQYKLVQCLPTCDRIVTEQGWIKPSASALTNEAFSKATAAWFTNLKDDRFTPEYLQRKRLEVEREKAKIDPWKTKHFEPVWGQSLRSSIVSNPVSEPIPRFLIPDRIPTVPIAGSGNSDADWCRRQNKSLNHSPQLMMHSAAPKVRASARRRPRPLSKQSPTSVQTTRSATVATGSEEESVVAAQKSKRDDENVVIPAKQGMQLSENLSANILPSGVLFARDKLWHQKSRNPQPKSHLALRCEQQASGSEDEGIECPVRNAASVPEIGSPEKRTGDSSPDKCRLTDSSPISSPTKRVTAPKGCGTSPVSPVRTRSQKKHRSGIMTMNSQGIDEQRSKDICKNVVARSANNKLFFVTQKGSIQQLSSEHDDTAPSPSLIKTLPNDTEIFPVRDYGLVDANRSPAAQLTVVAVNGLHCDGQKVSSDRDSSILNTILSNNRPKSDPQLLPQSYKLPDGITITPMTQNSPSNQVPVITRTECSSSSETSARTAHRFNGSVLSTSSTSQQTVSSGDVMMQELNRIPSQITVIPLGPSVSSVDLPVQGEGNEDELEMEQQEEDMDQVMGSTSSDCVCSLKAMIQCAECGALCHSECIGPSGYCVRCLVRVNNHTVSFVQSVPLIANTGAAVNHAAFLYPI